MESIQTSDTYILVSIACYAKELLLAVHYSVGKGVIRLFLKFSLRTHYIFSIFLPFPLILNFIAIETILSIFLLTPPLSYAK